MVSVYDKFAAQRQTALKKGLTRPHRFIENPAAKNLSPDFSGKICFDAWLRYGANLGRRAYHYRMLLAPAGVGINPDLFDLTAQAHRFEPGTNNS